MPIKMLLYVCHISLLPVVESDALNHSFFSLEKSSKFPYININSIPCCAVSVGSPVDSQVSCSVLSPEVSLGVPLCNRFASLCDECATTAALSDSHAVKYMEDNVSSGLTTVHALAPYPRSSTTPVLPPYFSTPAIPFAPTLSKKDPPSWDTDTFMPRMSPLMLQTMR